MSPLSATVTNCAGSQTLSRMQAEREQLTYLLRALASELDDLERRLSDIAWHLRGLHTGSAAAHLPGERAALQAQHERMNVRLHGLARQLSELDSALSGSEDQPQWPPARVGTCPDCGYPSLGSGLCASCRLYLVR